MATGICNAQNFVFFGSQIDMARGESHITPVKLNLFAGIGKICYLYSGFYHKPADSYGLYLGQRVR